MLYICPKECFCQLDCSLQAKCQRNLSAPNPIIVVQPLLHVITWFITRSVVNSTNAHLWFCGILCKRSKDKISFCVLNDRANLLERANNRLAAQSMCPYRWVIWFQVGALEYDPELPTKQEHRAFLRERVVFKEVVPISDPTVRAKIHQTYRIGYLKDVILARVLDDATFNTLSSLMLFNNVEVALALQSDPAFFRELFARLRAHDPTTPEWADLIAFLQVCFSSLDYFRYRKALLLLGDCNSTKTKVVAHMGGIGFALAHQ